MKLKFRSGGARTCEHARRRQRGNEMLPVERFTDNREPGLYAASEPFLERGGGLAGGGRGRSLERREWQLHCAGRRKLGGRRSFRAALFFGRIWCGGAQISSSLVLRCRRRWRILNAVCCGKLAGGGGTLGGELAMWCSRCSGREVSFVAGVERRWKGIPVMM